MIVPPVSPHSPKRRKEAKQSPGGEKRPGTIVSYFVTAGVDWKTCLGAVNALELMDNEFCSTLGTCIHDRYPSK